MNHIRVTDDDVLAGHNELEMMRRPHLWPFGAFLLLKHMVAESHGVPWTAILYHYDPNPKQKRQYIFLPGANMYNIPAEVWEDTTPYRKGGEAMLLEIVREGWTVT
jgi:hypothetical protein